MQGTWVMVTERQILHLIQVWDSLRQYIDDEPFNPARGSLSGAEERMWDETFYSKLRLIVASLDTVRAMQNGRPQKPWVQETIFEAQAD